jgi:hypothetical protein
VRVRSQPGTRRVSGARVWVGGASGFCEAPPASNWSRKWWCLEVVARRRQNTEAPLFTAPPSGRLRCRGSNRALSWIDVVVQRGSSAAHLSTSGPGRPRVDVALRSSSRAQSMLGSMHGVAACCLRVRDQMQQRGTGGRSAHTSGSLDAWC